MVLFFPVQQELDCINAEGHILGKITFDLPSDQYIFSPASATLQLSAAEGAAIAAKILGLTTGQAIIPMQDDD